MKATFIGAGNMAGALIGGLVARGIPAGDLVAIDPDARQRERITAAHAITARAAATDEDLRADVVVLAVKPQVMAPVAKALAGRLGDALVISVAAGIRATDIARWLGGHGRVVRCMPNTPALIGMGITGAAALAQVDDAARALAESILGTVGTIVWVDDESRLDAVTALSGSGPAYVFHFIEALERAGTAIGLPAGQSRQLAIATVRGAAELAARSGEPPSVLREQVTSKGGTTAAALAVMQDGAIDAKIAAGVAAALRRSIELGDEFGRD